MPKKEKKFNKAEYDSNYEKNNCLRFSVKLNKRTDKDVVDKFESVPNKIDYIRQLVLKDIAEEKNKQN